MSAGLIYDFKGLSLIEKPLKRLSRPQKTELLDIIGALVESQVRRRISDEKTSPSGEDWPAWSDAYAAKRPEGRTLLMNEDHMLDSITHLTVDKNSIEVGSNMIYAATHQFGDEDRGIPQREFLGVSEDNETDLIDAVDEFLDGVMQ